MALKAYVATLLHPGGSIRISMSSSFAPKPTLKRFAEPLAAFTQSDIPGSPADVAALVAWLVSDEATFVTGQVITVDGGRMTKLSLP